VKRKAAAGGESEPANKAPKTEATPTAKPQATSQAGTGATNKDETEPQAPSNAQPAAKATAPSPPMAEAHPEATKQPATSNDEPATKATAPSPPMAEAAVPIPSPPPQPNQLAPPCSAGTMAQASSPPKTPGEAEAQPSSSMSSAPLGAEVVAAPEVPFINL